MNFLTLFLLVASALSATFALKSPSLCNNDQGNKFVCSVIQESKQNTSGLPEQIKKANLTLPKYGRDAFFDTLTRLSVLSGALRTKVNQQSSKNRLLSVVLSKSAKQLDDANFRSTQLTQTAVLSISRFQESLRESQVKNANRIADVAVQGNALEKLSDRLLIQSYVNEHIDELTACAEKFVNELENLQNKTTEFAVGYHDSVVDLVDQIGTCVESNSDVTKCAVETQRKLSKLNSLPLKTSVATAWFNGLGGKSFDSYLCTRLAVRKFSNKVWRVTRFAKTTTAAPSTSSSNGTAAASSGTDSSASNSTSASNETAASAAPSTSSPNGTDSSASNSTSASNGTDTSAAPSTSSNNGTAAASSGTDSSASSSTSASNGQAANNGTDASSS